MFNAKQYRLIISSNGIISTSNMPRYWLEVTSFSGMTCNDTVIYKTNDKIALRIYLDICGAGKIVSSHAAHRPLPLRPSEFMKLIEFEVIEV